MDTPDLNSEQYLEHFGAPWSFSEALYKLTDDSKVGLTHLIIGIIVFLIDYFQTVQTNVVKLYIQVSKFKVPRLENLKIPFLHFGYFRF